MRLSEAIRLGAMLDPQVFGVTANEYGTCAIGGALKAIGVSGQYNEALNHWPIAGEIVTNPVRGDMHLLFGIVRELNDEHEWTRERIADWVESIELSRAELPQPVSTEEDVRA